jgi:hypothetical protein
MFDVKRPCKDCPFVKGSSTNQTLRPGRLEEIAHDITHDGHFFCHKTIDYNDDQREHEEKFSPKEGEHLCAGSILYMQREGKSTRFLEIMQLMGEYNPSDYKGIELIMDPIKCKKENIK